MQTGFENEDNELVANVASGEGVRRSTSGGVVQHQASPGNGNRRHSAVRPQPPRRSSSGSAFQTMENSKSALKKKNFLLIDC